MGNMDLVTALKLMHKEEYIFNPMGAKLVLFFAVLKKTLNFIKISKQIEEKLDKPSHKTWSFLKL